TQVYHSEKGDRSNPVTCGFARGNEDGLAAIAAARPAAPLPARASITPSSARWTYTPKPGDVYLKSVVYDLRKGAQGIDNYRKVYLQVRGQNTSLSASLFMLSVNFTPLNSLNVSGSHTMGFMAKSTSMSPPDMKKEIEDTFTSMGRQLSIGQTNQILDFSTRFTQQFRHNTLGTIHMSYEREDEIAYLCIPLGKAIFPDIEDCRPHRLAFFRHVMGLIDPSHSQWEDFKSLIKTHVFGGNDPEGVQGRVIIHRELFRTKTNHIAKQYTYGGPNTSDNPELQVVLFLANLFDAAPTNLSPSLEEAYNKSKKS
ncbi:MAG: hypothetical protein Q8K36_00610, partial [Alphaproteobacteria bacterium]|nr:hypothetical protein [Alphaproteobacteria bacterium]